MVKDAEAYSRSELVARDQEVEAAVARLHDAGKSPEDCPGAIADWNERGAVPVGWSSEQMLIGFELACLSTLHEIAYGRLSSSTVEVDRIHWWLAVAREKRLQFQYYETIGLMLPDFERGRKSRIKGAENHGSPATRQQRRKRLRDLFRDVLFDWVLVKRRPLESLKRGRHHQRVAELYHARYGVKVSSKTVERDLKAYAQAQ
jgi:hypothetical protein